LPQTLGLSSSTAGKKKKNLKVKKNPIIKKLNMNINIHNIKYYELIKYTNEPLNNSGIIIMYYY
jgi:hypothetical protein